MQNPLAPSVVCWGELLWDLFPSGARLGGAPANVAFHLHTNAVPSLLITRLGQDELGSKAREALRELGMDLRGLQSDASLPTGRVGIEVANGEASYTLHPGAWQALQCDTPARDLLAQAKFFCFGTLSQESKVGLASWREALACLPKDCVRVCDPNLRGSRIDAALVREHILAADILKINDEEAAVMAKTFDQRDLAAWLIGEMQVKLLALTHGAKGATLITKRAKEMHAGCAIDSASAANGRDNVGAGDSFTAVLIRAQLSGASLATTLQAANRYAAFVASRRGATPMPPSTLLAELQELMSPS